MSPLTRTTVLSERQSTRSIRHTIKALHSPVSHQITNICFFTESDYATFPIWHKEADLKMISLQGSAPVDTDILNSTDVESYHSWSSNGRWIIFSSRRLDGLYTRFFIAHLNKNGKFSKPFLLPQKDPDENNLRMKSFNIPEFIKDKITITRSQLDHTVTD